MKTTKTRPAPAAPLAAASGDGEAAQSVPAEGAPPPAPIEEPPAPLTGDESKPEAPFEPRRDAVLQGRMSKLHGEISRHRSSITMAQAAIASLEVEIGKAQAELDVLHPPMTAAERYRQVLARGNEERRKRAAAAAAAPPPTVRSKLDAAMMASGRRGHGLKRPSYPSSGGAH